jgi:hypothetical protein
MSTLGLSSTTVLDPPWLARHVFDLTSAFFVPPCEIITGLLASNPMPRGHLGAGGFALCKLRGRLVTSSWLRNRNNVFPGVKQMRNK